jgi:hypothetical protein
MVNRESSIEESRSPIMGADQPTTVKLFAHLFSYIFHPLFIPVYVTWFIVFIHPSYFSGFNTQQKIRIVITVASTMVFYPFITVLLLKGLGFSKSIFLKTQKERIIPYIACEIFFFWAYLVFRNQPEIPKILTSFTFGVFLSSSAALMVNIRMKISMHAIGMGGLLGIFLLIMFQNTMLMTWPIALALLITGLVCTSRMIVSDHTSNEIYTGLSLGLACQLIASVIILS